MQEDNFGYFWMFCWVWGKCDLADCARVTPVGLRNVQRWPTRLAPKRRPDSAPKSPTTSGPHDANRFANGCVESFVGVLGQADGADVGGWCPG
jgi:hypothetical protein